MTDSKKQYRIVFCFSLTFEGLVDEARKIINLLRENKKLDLLNRRFYSEETQQSLAHFCAEKGYHEMLRILLEEGGLNPNAKDLVRILINKTAVSTNASD